MRRTRRSETQLSSRSSKPYVMRPDAGWFAWLRSAKGCATGRPATPLRYASLPIARPRPADRSGERIKDQPVGQHTVALPAVVLQPGGMSGIGAEIFAAHRVMLAADHAAETGEIAFGEIGVDAILAIGLGMIDPLELKAACQQIPVGHFVRRQDRTWFHPRICKLNALSFAQEAPRQSAAAALAQHNHDPSLAATVLGDRHDPPWRWWGGHDHQNRRRRSQ